MSPTMKDGSADNEQHCLCAEDVFEELDKFGEIENLNVCDNLADHMVGSVYVKFKDENDAAKAMQARDQSLLSIHLILLYPSSVPYFRVPDRLSCILDT